jgi:uncharacterized repeat protein (TIGR01451 family)
MKRVEHERQDWLIILVILALGLMCVISAGQLALRFSPRWQLNTNMDSGIDPNSALLTRPPGEFVPALDSGILTQPSWLDVFLTPGASFVTRTPPPPVPTGTPSPAPTVVLSTTHTEIPTASPTATFVLFAPTWTATARTRATAITGTEPAPASSATPSPTFWAMASPTVTPVFTSTLTSTPTSAPTQLAVADLRITKNDKASTYIAGGTLIYVIRVSNAGPANVTGAVITDNLPPQISTWSWTCTQQNAGATGCDGMSGSTDFSDTINLPGGASIEYTVIAEISSEASGDLNNIATVSLPAGFTDPAPLNNQAVDTDQFLVAGSFPHDNIGDTKDGGIYIIAPGSSVVLAFNTPLSVGGHAGYDLVYYELAMDPGIHMDHVILQVSDGYNWYTIFNWGDNIPDTNANLNTDNPAIGDGGDENNPEADNRPIDASFLYDGTGIAIDLDGVVPNGTYPYIRIYSPTGDSGDGCEVDAIVILP